METAIANSASMEARGINMARILGHNCKSKRLDREGKGWSVGRGYTQSSSPSGIVPIPDGDKSHCPGDIMHSWYISIDTVMTENQKMSQMSCKDVYYWHLYDVRAGQVSNHCMVFPTSALASYSLQVSLWAKMTGAKLCKKLSTDLPESDLTNYNY